MDEYKIELKKGEGTYSEVFMAIDKKTNKKVALKIMKHKYETLNKIKKDKEIKALKTLAHSNIITLLDVLYSEK